MHPGDIVTCRLDMDVGTLNFDVNGVAQPEGFTGLKDSAPLHPCAIFYSSERIVTLLDPRIPADKAKLEVGCACVCRAVCG